MTPFISSRVRKLDVGISGYTDTDSVLNVTGKVSVGTAIDLVPYDTINNGTLRLEGSAGTLFSISNNLTSGSIFSVNDATGVPSLDVNANGTILLAPFGQTEYIGIGKTNPTQKVDIDGSIKLSGNLLFENINVISYSAADVGVDTISFEGSEGQLFSVTNNLSTGSLFSVNNVAGLPYIDVDADGTIIAGINADVGNFGIGTETPTEKLEVVGSIKASDGLILSDTGPYNTVIQYVTPTNNRNISFPDATGTIALVAGTTGNIQYNNAGKLAGSSDFNVDLDWNESSTLFTGLKLNVTDTASLSDSKLLDLQVGGTSKCSIDTVGNITLEDGAWLASKNDDIRLSLNSFGSGNFTVSKGIANDPNVYFSVRWANPIGVGIKRDLPLSWGDLSSNPQGQLVLVPDGDDTLAQRRGTNAQTYRLYNTYTDPNNYQRTSISDDNIGLIINQEYDGTGALRTNLLDIQDNGTSKVTITGNGNVGIGTSVNTNNSKLVVDGTISETVSGIQYPVVSQFDIGTDPNQIPLNQFLGDMAFADFPFAQVANNSNGAEATVVVNAQTTDLYSHIASYSTDVTYQISNLESGHEIKMYLRNTNASARTITIQASTTNSGYANVNLAPGAGTMGAASVSTVTLAATSGTTMIYVANIGGDIVGGILA